MDKKIILKFQPCLQATNTLTDKHGGETNLNILYNLDKDRFLVLYQYIKFFLQSLQLPQMLIIKIGQMKKKCAKFFSH